MRFCLNIRDYNSPAAVSWLGALGICTQRGDEDILQSEKHRSLSLSPLPRPIPLRIVIRTGQTFETGPTSRRYAVRSGLGSGVECLRSAEPRGMQMQRFSCNAPPHRKRVLSCETTKDQLLACTSRLPENRRNDGNQPV
ncbi:hypothetical protein ZHAS_00015235 [Anopheles sinensis]|uniref:Uncharacterized protein n=1 Tax=Anopheles sinensis TaxID=74873 RepID=A0A084WAG7_ANOSI|nr:hypothetical protein ZHAS_00015235 [Anopheles sinensis]